MTITYDAATTSLKVYSDLIAEFATNSTYKLKVTLNDCCTDTVYTVDYADGLTPTMDADGYFIRILSITSPVNKVTLELTTTLVQTEIDCIYEETLLPCSVIDNLKLNLENLATLLALQHGKNCSSCFCDEICILYKSLFNDESNDCGC
jgi:hypothetical protein